MSRECRGLVGGLTLCLSVLACSRAGAPRVLYHDRLESLDGLLTRAAVSLDTSTSRGAAIRIDSQRTRTVRLAEVRTEDAETVVLTYRGHLRAERLDGRAYLEMRCDVPGRGQLTSKAPQDPLTGTTDWVTQVTRLSLGNRPGERTVRLNVVVEGSGAVWVDNILLAQAAR